MRLSVHIEGLDTTSAEFDAIEARAANLAIPLDRLGLHHQRKATRILRSGERGVGPRSGHLAQSMTYDLPGTNELVIGSDRPQARYLQFGGEIVPLGHPYLAIPFGEALNVRGVVKPEYDRPLREIEDLAFVRTDEGKLIAGVRRKERKRRRPQVKRQKRTAFESAMEIAAAGIERFKALFVLLPKVAGRAFEYATHDPDDQARWERFAADWLLRGR